MSAAPLADRILRVLRRGPCYLGFLVLVLGEPEPQVRAALAELMRAGRVERRDSATYRVVRDG